MHPSLQVQDCRGRGGGGGLRAIRKSLLRDKFSFFLGSYTNHRYVTCSRTLHQQCYPQHFLYKEGPLLQETGKGGGQFWSLMHGIAPRAATPGQNQQEYLIT